MLSVLPSLRGPPTARYQLSAIPIGIARFIVTARSHSACAGWHDAHAKPSPECDARNHPVPWQDCRALLRLPWRLRRPPRLLRLPGGADGDLLCRSERKSRSARQRHQGQYHVSR